jgi:hypothetical protein
VNTLFTAWFIATVLHQFGGLRKYSRYLDFQGFFLPIWTFFAPYPGTQDPEIVARTFTLDGTPTPWRAVQIYEPRRPLHVLIHVNRRLEKTVFDAVAEITPLLNSTEIGSTITGSIPYVTLLSVVSARMTFPFGATHLQFMVVESAGFDQSPHGLRPLFTSARHRIEYREGRLSA